MRATPASSGLPVGRAFPKYTYHPRAHRAAPWHGADPAGTHPHAGLCRCGTHVPPTSVRRPLRAMTASCWPCASKGECGHGAQAEPGTEDSVLPPSGPGAEPVWSRVSSWGCVYFSCGAPSPSSRAGGTWVLSLSRSTFRRCSPGPGVPRAAENRAEAGAQQPLTGM